jgi:DNA adenine methylase
MGGKSRIAKKLADVMLGRSQGRGMYLEPFVGGGNMATHMGHHFSLAHYSDYHEDLALMWAAVLDGWVPPVEVTEEAYQEARYADAPSARRGFIGFACSFGGRWFEGYARSRSVNFAAQQSRLVVQQAEGMKGDLVHTVAHSSFFDLETPPANSVAYLDPPYASTKAYSSMQAFDHARFWAQAAQWSLSGVDVYVSEQNAPAGWTPIWEREVKRSLNVENNVQPAMERLFVLEDLI